MGLFCIWLSAAQSSPGVQPAVYASKPAAQPYKLPANTIVWATKRKPLLFQWLFGWLLLRSATRALFQWLFHEPPRKPFG